MSKDYEELMQTVTNGLQTGELDSAYGPWAAFNAEYRLEMPDDVDPFLEDTSTFDPTNPAHDLQVTMFTRDKIAFDRYAHSLKSEIDNVETYLPDEIDAGETAEAHGGFKQWYWDTVRTLHQLQYNDPQDMLEDAAVAAETVLDTDSE